MNFFKRYVAYVMVSIFASSFSGSSCEAMEDKPEINMHPMKPGLDPRWAEWYDLLDVLPSLKMLGLNFAVSEDYLAGLYRVLLPWIADGNTFTYSTRKLNQYEYYTMVVGLMNPLREAYLAKNHNASLPAVETHLSTENSDSSAEERGSKPSLGLD